MAPSQTAWQWLWAEIERRLGADAAAELREGMRQRSRADYVRTERARRLKIVQRFEQHERHGTLTDIGRKILKRERNWLDSHREEE